MESVNAFSEINSHEDKVIEIEKYPNEFKDPYTLVVENEPVKDHFVSNEEHSSHHHHPYDYSDILLSSDLKGGKSKKKNKKSKGKIK